jgi:hypothetical protein
MCGDPIQMGFCNMAAVSASHPLPPPLDAIPPRSWAPDRSDAWWWLYLPILLLIGLVVIAHGWPAFYRDYILPEGYGFLELGHLLIPLAAAIVSLKLLRRGVVKASWLLWGFVFIYGLGNFYIAGEEHSWGQHFFNWGTPDYWTAINRQAETNLHNVSHWFNHRPRLVIEIGILVGGIIIPLLQTRTGPFRQPLLALLTPPVQLTVVAVIALLVKVIDQFGKGDLVEGSLLPRPSEAMETFIYLYLLYYAIVLARRINTLEAAGVRRVPL